jgi:hypothetical protein
MEKFFAKDKLIAALKRAMHTFFQALCGYIIVGKTLSEIDWVTAFSVAAVAALASICKSLAVGTPESDTAGTMYIDTTDPETDRYMLSMDQLEGLSEKKSVQIKISTDKKLEGETKYIGE